MAETLNQHGAGCQRHGVSAAPLGCGDVNDGDDGLQMPGQDVVPPPVIETGNADRRRALPRETALRALI